MNYRYLLFDDHPGMIRGIESYLNTNSVWKCAGTACSCDTAIELFEKIVEDLSDSDLLVAFVDASFTETEESNALMSEKPNSFNSQGFNIIKHIKQSKHPIPCIVYSSYDFGWFIEYAMSEEVAADGYVLKSADESILLSALNEVSHGRGFIQKELLENYTQATQVMSTLTKREKEVFDLACIGKTNSEIADTLGKNVRTIENYMTRLYDKLAISNRQELVSLRSLM